MGPGDLEEILHLLPREINPDLLVGLETRDDAGIYQISEDLALVQTVDFFTPIVDDPYDFGEIAVANSLSDIYAMGGIPKTGLNILGYPESTIDKSIIAEILKGGYNKAKEGNVSILGGHSVKDPELKFGMSVTGIINPKEVVRNNGARPGDQLILTKPLGTGILTTALKNEKLPEDLLSLVSQKMRQLNNFSSELMKRYKANACTDITGFGLLGHLFEMVQASNVSTEIISSRVPLLPGTLDFSRQKQLPGGLKDNQKYLTKFIQQKSRIDEELLNILFDPQTSGGLLISIPAEHAENLLKELENKHTECAIVGEVTTKNEIPIQIV